MALQISQRIIKDVRREMLDGHTMYKAPPLLSADAMFLVAGPPLDERMLDYRDLI